jgi:hypothetical protein
MNVILIWQQWNVSFFWNFCLLWNAIATILVICLGKLDLDGASLIP